MKNQQHHRTSSKLQGICFGSKQIHVGVVSLCRLFAGVIENLLCGLKILVTACLGGPCLAELSR